MASKKEIKKHLKIALEEIGEIKPWFDKKFHAWIFSHKNYPVEYAGDSEEDVIKNYPLYLTEFIRHRLNANLSPVEEKKTRGHGGKRVGAGRPKGTKKEVKLRVYLPKDIADWMKNNPATCIPSIRRLMAKSRH
jgi:hypothetical protein